MADEPAGDLGGAQGKEGLDEEDPYGGAASAEDDVAGYLGEAPSGGPAEDDVAGYLGGAGEGDPDVDGYLGGATDAEELPALPPSEGSYSHRDFIEGEEDEGAYEDPYVDPYAAEAVDEGAYEDPYGMPADAAAYDQYEGYDAGAVAEGDPSYFDSMAHEGGSDLATQPASDFVDGDDDDSPKTISQQDAESIIRRITTKRILPPEGPSVAGALPARLNAAGGGLRIWPLLLGALLLSAVGVFLFKDYIANRWPGLAPYLGVTLVVDGEEQKVDSVDPNELKKQQMLEMVLKSERKAFGASEADIAPRAAPGAPERRTGPPRRPGQGGD